MQNIYKSILFHTTKNVIVQGILDINLKKTLICTCWYSGWDWSLLSSGAGSALFGSRDRSSGHTFLRRSSLHATIKSSNWPAPFHITVYVIEIYNDLLWRKLPCWEKRKQQLYPVVQESMLFGVFVGLVKVVGAKK